mmetsp:Transcript_90304/g.269430  ORF Transcript_90304/g.269430 Transcript_90304/m.269430 type:complete len:502 (+) Transcript_90304:1196-2701(+)
MVRGVAHAGPQHIHQVVELLHSVLKLPHLFLLLPQLEVPLLQGVIGLLPLPCQLQTHVLELARQRLLVRTQPFDRTLQTRLRSLGMTALLLKQALHLEKLVLLALQGGLQLLRKCLLGIPVLAHEQRLSLKVPHLLLQRLCTRLRHIPALARKPRLPLRVPHSLLPTPRPESLSGPLLLRLHLQVAHASLHALDDGLQLLGPPLLGLVALALAHQVQLPASGRGLVPHLRYHLPHQVVPEGTLWLPVWGLGFSHLLDAADRPELLEPGIVEGLRAPLPLDVQPERHALCHRIPPHPNGSAPLPMPVLHDLAVLEASDLEAYVFPDVELRVRLHLLRQGHVAESRRQPGIGRGRGALAGVGGCVRDAPEELPRVEDLGARCALHVAPQTRRALSSLGQHTDDRRHLAEPAQEDVPVGESADLLAHVRPHIEADRGRAPAALWILKSQLEPPRRRCPIAGQSVTKSADRSQLPTGLADLMRGGARKGAHEVAVLDHRERRARE